MEAILSAGTAVNGASAKHAYDVLVDVQRSSAMFLVDEPKYLGANSLSTALVMNIMSKARTCDEETFGPSATIYVIDTDKDAIVMTNESACGLPAATHSRSWERAYRMITRSGYGQVAVNNMTTSGASTQAIRRVKWSGWGQSNTV